MTDYSALRAHRVGGRKPGATGANKKTTSADRDRLEAKANAMLRAHYKSIGRDDLAAAIAPPNRRRK